MKAMILAAGFGTRLRPLTHVLPKPMFPLLGRPLLHHLIDQLSASGIHDIAVNIHHLPQKVTEYFGDGGRFGVRLRFFREEKILGTAGGIKAAADFFDDEPFLVINSDIVVNIDLRRVIAFHREKGSRLTLVVRQDVSPEQYDPIEIGADGHVAHFVGTSSKHLSGDTTRVMFTGIQIMDSGIIARIPEGRFCGTTQDVFPEMIEDGLPVFGFLHSGYWIDTGTREHYLKANFDALEGKVSLSRSTDTDAVPGANLAAPVFIEEGCRIAPGARVGPFAILGRECAVGENAVVQNSVCWNGARIGPGARVEHSVLAQGVSVSANARVQNQSLIPPLGGA